MRVLGIDFRDTKAGAREFYRETRARYPSLFDPAGRLAARVGVSSVPTVVVLDRRHRIVARIAGGVTRFDLEDVFRRYVR